MHGRCVTLFVPVDRDGLEVIYRKTVLQNVDVTSVTKGEVVLYVFYDKVKFLRCGKRIQPFKLREGAFISLGEPVSPYEEFTVGLPDRGIMRICEAEHFIAGSLRVHHTRLVLK